MKMKEYVKAEWEVGATFFKSKAETDVLPKQVAPSVNGSCQRLPCLPNTLRLLESSRVSESERAEARARQGGFDFAQLAASLLEAVVDVASVNPELDPARASVAYD